MIELRDVSLALGGGRRGGEVRFHLDALEVGAGEAVALRAQRLRQEHPPEPDRRPARGGRGPGVCGWRRPLHALPGEARPTPRSPLRDGPPDLPSSLAPFTATENVVIGLPLRRAAPPGLRDHAVEALRRVGLGERLESRPHEGLSVGERQRVAIARALVGNAPILLADEPTGALDPTTGRAIHQLLRRVADEDGGTLVMVTHDLALAADLPRAVDCSGLISTPDTRPDTRPDARPDDEHVGARP